MMSTRSGESGDCLLPSRTMSSLRCLQPVTPHVHGTVDPETCLVLEEEGDPDLGFTLGSVNNLLCDLTQTLVSSRYPFPPTSKE